MESGEKDYITKKDVIDMPSALNNQVNLCDSCTYTYPECPSEKDDVIFGNGIGNDNICACNKYQPTIQSVATDINVGDKISKFIDGLEEIFADLRERHVDDSVCGLCEYDGAYMGQSGDWCNECPGFEKDDCFKLSDKTRREWTDEILKALPSAQSQERTEKRMETHACDLISRKEAVDAAKDWYEGLICGSINGLIKRLNVLPTIQPSPQWIPCSEKMPEEHEWLGTKKFGTTISDEVYVTFENEKGERFCMHLSFQNGELSSYDQFHMDTWYKGSKPIAWMPLPDAYKEGGEKI